MKPTAEMQIWYRLHGHSSHGSSINKYINALFCPLTGKIVDAYVCEPGGSNRAELPIKSLGDMVDLHSMLGDLLETARASREEFREESVEANATKRKK